MPATPTATVVFFGPERSGKSALWARFARLAAPGFALPPHETVGRELVPLTLPPPPGADGTALELIDCDGQAAHELITNPDAVGASRRRGGVVSAVLRADALVVVFDAAASPETVRETFVGLDELLDRLEQERTFSREVGGLPVFLTLTKCDKLHVPGEQAGDWLARVEAAVAGLKAEFRRHFGDDEPEAMGFGSLDVEAVATADRVPTAPGFDLYADADGSFGVRDLWDDCRPAALEHLARSGRSRRRMNLTVVASLTLLSTMLAGVAAFLLLGGFEGNRLAERVAAYRVAEPLPADRLADKHIARTGRQLASLRTDPDYDTLPPQLRDYVEGRQRELADYQAYRQLYQPPRLGPAEARNLEQADRLAADLAGPLKPPAGYAEAWADTEAVRLWKKWSFDLNSVRATEGELHTWYRGLTRQANELLLTESPPDFGWRSQAQALLTQADTPPVRAEDAVPDSPEVPVVRGKRLTYAAAFRYERVATARRDWDDTRARLAGLRDLADAVGLTSGPGTPGPALELPEPSADAVGSRELATSRLAALRVAFPPRNPSPRLSTRHFPAWVAAAYPDAVRRAVEVRLRSISDAAARHVRAMLRVRLAGQPESLAQWHAVADELGREPVYRDWDELLQLLADLAERHKPGADLGAIAGPGPLTRVADFLKRDAFEIDAARVELVLPDDLAEQRLTPAGPLTITVTTPGQTPRGVGYSAAGTPRRERSETTFALPRVGAGKLLIKPGDEVTASLPLTAGGQAYKLVWAAGRSTVFGFDCLNQPPRLERGGPAGPARGVRLRPDPPGAFPEVPALLPDLRPRLSN